MKPGVIALLVLPFVAAGAPAAELPKAARAFLESHCVDCHSATNKKGGLDLNAVPTDLDDLPTEAKWTLVFDRVRRGEMPPKKARPPAEEVSAFTNALGDFLAGHDAARRATSGRVAWRRLNRVEYENTVHDLLAIDTPLVALLPEDGSAHGFDNVSQGLRLSSTQIDGYLTAADAALNAAISLDQRPRPHHTRVAGRDLPVVKRNLGKPSGSLNKDGSKYMQYFRALPDGAAAVFENGLWDLILRDMHADAPGRFRIRLSAYAYQAKDRPPVVLKVMASDFLHNRFGAAFDLEPDKPRVIEYTMRLDNEMFWLSSTGCNYSPDGASVQTVGGETYAGTAMALQWIELEGPLLESWPPPSTRRVFGHLPIKPADKPQHGRFFEVVSSKPADDAATLVTGFAERAFRRPVTPEDTAVYIRLAQQVLSQGGSLERALRRAYKAILVSPKFLFLQERPGPLDDYALASRLAYFLWSTAPDEELLKLAAGGRLRDPATLRAQTERLLASPKAHAFTRNFCGQWLNLRAIDATMPDGQLYPEFDQSLRDAMVGETEAFFGELLRADLGVTTFVQSDFAMLNRRLAEHYGIPGIAGEQFRKVTLPAGSHRGGVLTQASVLKVTANGTLSSPVIRGAWVAKRILGREMQPPPPDAGAIEPDTRGATTIREQLEKHRRSNTCAACHQHMDPLGLALESYDVIGGWRDHYRSVGQGAPVIDPITKRHRGYRQGLAVDPSGKLADGRSFANIDGLKELLCGQSETIAENVTNNLVTYATGAGITFADRAEIEAILRTTRAGGHGLRSLVHAVVQSPLFRSK